MRRYTELLAALALSTGMALHAQTNEMVIQAKKLVLKSSRQCTDSF